jgi:hypothetical protein
MALNLPPSLFGIPIIFTERLPPTMYGLVNMSQTLTKDELIAQFQRVLSEPIPITEEDWLRVETPFPLIAYLTAKKIAKTTDPRWDVITSNIQGTEPGWIKAAFAAFEDLSFKERILCAFGNPFRKVEIKDEWLQWRDSTIPKMAVDHNNAFVVADALEEAGCYDETILSHLRTGPHNPACWALRLCGNADPQPGILPNKETR